MKRTVRLIVVLLAVMTAGTLALSAQRGMRGMRGMRTDSMEVKRSGMEQMPFYRGVQPGMRNWSQGPGFRMPRQGMYGRGPEMRRPVPGMRNRGMDMETFRGMRPGGYGLRSMDNMPDLSDKQKQQIEELRKKQQEDMEKFRSEMHEKMKQMRDSHRSGIRDLLTDEQKKWFDGNNPDPKE